MDPGLLGAIGALLSGASNEGEPGGPSIAILTVPGRGIVGTAITPNGPRLGMVERPGDDQRVIHQLSTSCHDGHCRTVVIHSEEPIINSWWFDGSFCMLRTIWKGH